MKSEKYTMDGIGQTSEAKEPEEVAAPVEDTPVPPKKSTKTKLMKVNGTSKLRVRSAPDADEDNVIGTLSRGDLVKVVAASKSNPKFSEILFNDGTGFVMSEFLELA